MSGLVQHKSSSTTTNSLPATFSSPVTKGNLIIAIVSYDGTDTFTGVSDGSNTYSQAINAPIFSKQIAVLYAIAGATGTLTVTASWSNAGGNSRRLQIYEVSGYDTLDQTGSNTSGSATSLSVNTSASTIQPPEFVLAAFLDFQGTGITWTPGSGYSAGETTELAVSSFSEFEQVSSLGIQSASASVNVAASLMGAVIVTFYSSIAGPAVIKGSIGVCTAPAQITPVFGSFQGTPPLTVLPSAGSVSVGQTYEFDQDASGKIVEVRSNPAVAGQPGPPLVTVLGVKGSVLTCSPSGPGPGKIIWANMEFFMNAAGLVPGQTVIFDATYQVGAGGGLSAANIRPA